MEKTTVDSDFSTNLENLVKREFDTDKPNSVWVTDITYIWTYAGFEYLTSVMDLFTRKIIAWDLLDNLTVDSVIRCIKREWLKRFEIKDLEHAQQLVFEYIETFYNTVRIHGTLGYIFPNQYEKQYENSRNAI